MSFLDNMPSRNAASFSLLVAGEASGRSLPGHQRAQQYLALNDTRPPEGQVIGMCLGHSVLGYDWHQQQLRPPAEKQPTFTRPVPYDGGVGCDANPRELSSMTPPGPSPRAAPAAVDSTIHSTNTGFRREYGGGEGGARGGGGGGGGSASSGRSRANALQGNRNSDSEAQGEGLGRFERSGSRGGDNAPGGRSRAREGVTGAHAAAAAAAGAAAATTSTLKATGSQRRTTKARVETTSAPPAEADVAMTDGVARSATAGRQTLGAAAGSTGCAQGESGPQLRSVGGAGSRGVGATWSGKRAGSAAGGGERPGAAHPFSFGEGGRWDEGAAAGEAAPVAPITRGRVGMRKARRTYGR